MVASQPGTSSPPPKGISTQNQEQGATPSFMSTRPVGPPDDDEIAISGISGRFPESGDMNEFMENLLNGVDMVTVNERRFKPGLYGVPRGFGTLKEIDKFDADAFGMLPPQVRKTDPQLRITLETVYEALCDAGVNPADVRGSRTGVFLGVCTTEAQNLLNTDPNRLDGLGLIGCAHSMLANRLSYAFDFKGPSAAYDTACSTSAFALEAAIAAMRTGRCDSAIVTASTLILTPTVTVQFDRLGMLARDSACKSFDRSGDGFARAETVATIYLQRASVARRAYATMVHVKTNTDGYKGTGITFPSAGMQEELLREVYRELYPAVRKEDVAYVEAHGTGTAAGDPEELNAIVRTFKPNAATTKKKPLLIGSVKSNMGHAEGASGLCSIAKIIVMLQTGIIPANLHYKRPAWGLHALRTGELKVVDENTKWDDRGAGGSLIAINSFGFGGVNVHIVLKPFGDPLLTRESEVPTPLTSSIDSNQLRLIFFCGRNEAGVETALRKIRDSSDPNLYLLANELCKTPNPVATVRGFAVSGTDVGMDVLHIQQAPASSPPPLWLVFNGIGSQWPGMCRDLLRLPIFAQSIEACAQTLQERFNFDLYQLLSSETTEPYEKAVNCFVAITACQIGLVDVLRSLGLRPSGFLGHSAGEMGCAYMDECLTAEETIILAYLRGQSLEVEEDQEPGAMAAVSLGWPQVEKLCPPGVYPACHNGLDSVTISGAASAVGEFVRYLKAKKKGVTEVKSCGVAFHSPCIARASRVFLETLRDEFSRPPLARSTHWISTSIPETEWGEPLAATASPEYFVNNFLSPVLFYEALQHVPKGATVLEVGPCGLLRGLVKRACPSATVIPLQSRNSKDGLLDLLTALGKLYLTGVNFDVNRLLEGESEQKSRRFPVPLGTPFISPLVAGAWNHATSWDVPYFGMNGELQLSRFDVDLSSEHDSFLAGHVIQGRVLFPAMGYLVLVWRHFALTRGCVTLRECPVVFEHVRLHRVTVLGRRDRVEFRIHISEVSGAFEVIESGAVVGSGTVRCPDTNPAVQETLVEEAELIDIESRQLPKLQGENGDADTTGSQTQLLEGEELYRRFRFYGFEYTGAFCGLIRADVQQGAYLINWDTVTNNSEGNWVAFLDALLQTGIEPFDPALRMRLPTGFDKLVLDPEAFLQHVENNGVQVFVHKNQALGLVKCHGVELHAPKSTTVQRSRREQAPELSVYRFVPYFDDPSGEDEGKDADAMLHCVGVAMENLTNRHMSGSFKMTVIEASPKEVNLEISAAVERLIRHGHGVTELDYTIFAEQSEEDDADTEAPPKTYGSLDLRGFDDFHKEAWLDRTYDLIILHAHTFLALIALEYLKKGKFLLLNLPRAQALSREQLLDTMGSGNKLLVVAVKYTTTHVVYLIRRRNKLSLEIPRVIRLSDDLSWVEQLKETLREEEEIARAAAEKPDAGHTYGKQRRPRRLYLLAHGREGTSNGIQGLVNCLRREPYTENVRIIFDKRVIHSHEDFDFENPDDSFLAELLRHDLVMNVIDESGRWGFYDCCTQLEEKTASCADSAFVGMDKFGDLSSFRWIEGPDYHELGKAGVLPAVAVPIDVHYAALNFKDIMLATGALPASDGLPSIPNCDTPQLPLRESPLGLEFAGVTVEGRRICGYVEGQALATQVLGVRDQMWEVPDTWSLAEAATVPVVYSTAYFALVERARITEGESVLIHSGAGGVGQAAIRIVLSHGCIVFTTVGSVEKREWLLNEFPSIPACRVGNSRDTSFEAMVLRQTNGRGVDVVLNSLTGDKLEASVRCLARHGRFLEIGKFDLVANKPLGLELFLRDASFHGVMLDTLHDARPELRHRVHELVRQGIADGNGVVQPLPSRVFTAEQVEPAFRYLGGGKHVGKVLIQIRAEPDVAPSLGPAPRVYFDPTASYIVAGGLGGIGLEFINWMIGRGARRIVITSRSGVRNAYQAEYIRAWEAHGTMIRVLRVDASIFNEARTVIDEAESLGPLDGFFNLAMQLELGLMRDQTVESFRAAFAPKIDLTNNFDMLTRARARRLTYFVVFSSIVSSMGLPGQCNYGAANAAVEQICERRARDGLTGKAVQLGPISDAGFFHQMFQGRVHRAEELRSYGGVGIQSVRSVLRCLDVLLTAPRDAPIVVSRVQREDGRSSTRGGRSGPGESLVDKLSHVLGTDVAKLPPKAKLTELGLDSIVAMELRQVLEQDFGLNLSATEIRSVTLEQLIELSKNSEKNTMGPGGSGGVGRGRTPPRPRAATADLFQFNFMRNAKKSKIFYKQCVHPLNKLTDTTQGSVFVCNSVEGPHILRILGAGVRKPTYAMQFPQDAPLDDLHVFIDFYLRELKATAPTGPYVIAGYSAGALVAIELALRLQELGETPSRLVLIDMTPGRVDALLEENFGADRTRLEEMDVMIVVLSQILNIDRAQVEAVLASLPDRESRLEKAVELGHAIFDEDVNVRTMERLLGENQLKIINFFNQYKPTGTYTGPVNLVRTKQNLISYDSTEYWGLEEFCTQIPSVTKIESTHSYLVAEPGVHQVTAVINQE